ncbi:hypothetical protein QJU89_05845 [Pasteurella skyensis]|uniref:Uncharacterized protein n=1 Tax=Phocoenobacter skyensis TaxID=97481 RepID=A0AAJ6N9E0_9PAST|nr:hypothetical protein [Pasteurella skyensis]MDP8162813.1 hypothetical protein [Pasteurella skyensis]MDP8172600.1 hypothetical protein [Pasteurella skyensis]MDP8179100.1 hypothetical protein [Pasteurella skyensis]MDP8183215.1 hypothetical protein [Pasteurella skyensis]MDP8189266.1 hypothetical protein [Pasteurella skyensis]
MKDQDKLDAMLNKLKDTNYKASLTFALAEWAEEKLTHQEVLDTASLREWANMPNRKKSYVFAVSRFLDEINASTITDK